MFSARLPNLPSLFCAATTLRFRGADLSGTGLDESREEAEARRDSELAEGKARLLFSQSADSESIRLQDTCSGEAYHLPAAQLFGCPSHLSFAQGIAANPDHETALRNAILEAVERYASLNWWAGKRAAAQPSPSANSIFQELQERWMRKEPRRTALLDISPDLGLPVFVAWSCREDGRDLCFGTACGRHVREALSGALRELFQMEFGLDVVRYRRRHGVKLARKERLVLARASRLKRENCKALLTPHRAGTEATDASAGDRAGNVAEHLADKGFRLFAAELPRPDPLHQVVQVVAPDLPLPSPRKPGNSGETPSAIRCRVSAPWSAWDLY